MVKVFYLLRFERFRGTKSINELPFYPVEFHTGKEELLKVIRKRGVHYMNYVQCKPGASQMFTYVGNAYGDRRKVLASSDEDMVS